MSDLSAEQKERLRNFKHKFQSRLNLRKERRKVLGYGEKEALTWARIPEDVPLPVLRLLHWAGFVKKKRTKPVL